MQLKTPIARLACLCVTLAAMPAAGEEVLFADSMRRVDVILTRDDVAADSAVSTDGDGSLKIEATKARTVRLFEIDDPDVEQARLVYRARVRTRDVDGKVFLEMWCRIPAAVRPRQQLKPAARLLRRERAALPAQIATQGLRHVLARFAKQHGSDG